MFNLSDKNEKKLMAVLVIVFSGLYISLVWNNNVWMDEAFTASLVHTDFAGVISRSMADTLPPLYNILLKLMISVFGYYTPVMKITSVIPMVLTLVMGATVVRRRFGFLTAVLFDAFITFMPLTLYYGVEIRMYSLGFFFATAAGIYSYEVVNEGSRKNLVLFSLYSALAGYSHHFAFVTVAFYYLYLLLYFFFTDKKRLKEWIKCLIGTFIIYLPCLVVTIRQFSRVSGYFSMPEIDAKMFLQYCEYPYITGFWPATILCALVAAAAIGLVIRDIASKTEDKKQTIFAAASFLTYYGVLIFGTAVCKIMTANIFVDRYLFFAIGGLWLCAAIMLGRKPSSFYVAAAAALIIGICTYSSMIVTEYGNSADEEMAFLRANVREGDVYVSIGGHEEMQNCIPFYTYLDSECAELEFVSSLEPAIKRAKERGSTLWISVLENSAVPGEDEEILKEYGLKMRKMADFEFDRYRCEFYKADASDL